MAYNRVGTPKFYIDAVLLAKQWGDIVQIVGDKFNLNPSNVTSPALGGAENQTSFIASFKNRIYIRTSK